MTDLQFITAYTVELTSGAGLHSHEQTELVLHHVGFGRERRAGGEWWPFEAGSISVHPAGMQHEQRNQVPGEDYCLHLALTSEIEAQLLEVARAGFSLPGGLSKELRQIFYDLCASPPQTELSPFHQCAQNSRVAYLFYSLLDSYQHRYAVHVKREFSPSNEFRGNMTEGEQVQEDKLSRILQRAHRFIQSHFMDDISIQGLADEAEISADYLRHSYKERYGVSPRDALMRIRIARACELLRHSTMKIDEVAQRSGFKNAKYLCTRFQHYLQKSPGQYRKERFRSF